ncbi:hypothetical protein B9Z55_015833 [Caenorhabditis nigoni]|uniref:Chromo domain-containing protein n=1 Tax=Caenorhabditis nigoni TaxID=1611254 RepID=A0A2G5UBY1_9PELO|nr:hypothetical protein B9Z55_015833 [Caenorhabditis nigoni]
MSDPPPTPPGLLHDSSLPQSPLIVATDDGTESSGPPSSINLNQTQMTQLVPISQVDPRRFEYLANRLKNQMSSGGAGQVEGQAAPLNFTDVAATFRNILVDSKAEDLHNFMNTMVDQPGTSNGSSDLLTLLGNSLTIPGPPEPSKDLPGPSELSKDVPGPSEPSKELPGPSESFKESDTSIQPQIASYRSSDPSTSSTAKSDQPEGSTVETQPDLPGPSEPSNPSPPIQPESSTNSSDVSKTDHPESSSSEAKSDLPGPSEPSNQSVMPSTSTVDQPESSKSSVRPATDAKDASTDGLEKPRQSERPKAKRSTKQSRSSRQSSSVKLDSTEQSFPKADQPEPSGSSGQSIDSHPSGTYITEFKRCYPCKMRRKLEEPGPSEQLEDQEQGSKPKKRKNARVENEYFVDRIIDCRCVRGVLSLRTYWEGPYPAEWLRIENFVNWKENNPVFIYIVNNFEKFRKCYRQWKNKPTEDIYESEFDWVDDKISTNQINRPIDEEWSNWDNNWPKIKSIRTTRFPEKFTTRETQDTSDYSWEKHAQDMEMAQLNTAVKLAISSQGKGSSKERWEPVSELVKRDYPIHLPLENGENLVDFVAKNGSMSLLTLLLERGAFPSVQLSTPIESIVEEYLDKVTTIIEKEIPGMFPNLKIGSNAEDFKSMLKSLVSVPFRTLGQIQKELNVQIREGQKFGLMVVQMESNMANFCRSEKTTEFELFFNEQRLQPKLANLFEATPLQGPNRLEFDFPKASGNFLVVVPVWFTETA